jgi:DNA helicase-2/ATP-dependent DNA helicase PcrA
MNAGVMTDALTWAGTFHGIGARLLRDYADQIGLDPAFTIHDREDSADLMNLVRHELGFSKTESAFPPRARASRSIRAASTPRRRSRGAGPSYPWCVAWAAELKELFAAYVEAKQRQNVLDYDDLLLYWAQMMAEPDHRRRYRRALRPRHGRRISGHQPAAILDPAGAEAGWPRPDRGRRRRPIDLFVPRRDRAQHPRLSRGLLAARGHHHARPNYRSTSHPGRRQRRDRSRQRALHQEPLDRPHRGAQKPQLVTVRDEADQARFIVERVLANREPDRA